MATWKQHPLWSLCTTAWALLTVPLTALLILLTAPVLGPRRAYRLFTRLCVRQLLAVCGVRFEVEGLELLPEAIREGRSPAVFMANHQSNLDPPMLVAAIPAGAVFISKKQVRWIPLVGWAAWAAGTIFIDRGRRERAIASLKHAAEQIRGGKSVVIFPEGTRTRSGALGPFKKGGFILAQDAGVPIVPVGLHGAFAVLPPKSRRIRPGRIRLRFGAPVESAGRSRDELMAQVRERVEALASEGARP